MATGPLILVARNDLGIKSVRELIDHANKNPDKLRFGAGGGTGSSLYLATELLKARTGIKVTIVPYRGAAPALNDLLGGHIDAMFDAMPVMVTQAKAGKVTPLAVTSAKRSPALPDVPTILEAGVNYEIAGWFGILAPANTPPADRPAPARRGGEGGRGCPTWSTQLDGQGMQPVGSQPEAWRAYLQVRARDLHEDHQGLRTSSPNRARRRRWRPLGQALGYRDRAAPAGAKNPVA